MVMYKCSRWYFCCAFVTMDDDVAAADVANCDGDDVLDNDS